MKKDKEKESSERRGRRRRTELYSRDSWGSTKRNQEKKKTEKRRKSGKINRCRAGTHKKGTEYTVTAVSERRSGKKKKKRNESRNGILRGEWHEKRDPEEVDCSGRGSDGRGESNNSRKHWKKRGSHFESQHLKQRVRRGAGKVAINWTDLLSFLMPIDAGLRFPGHEQGIQRLIRVHVTRQELQQAHQRRDLQTRCPLLVIELLLHQVFCLSQGKRRMRGQEIRA